MTVKTTGIVFKAFYSDLEYWDDEGKTYHDDTLLCVDGVPVDDYDAIKPDDVVTIEGGYVINPKVGKSDSFEGYFKHWRKRQSVTCLIVEIPKDKKVGLTALVKELGGKVIE